MFWGRGDSSKLDEDEKKTLGHLRRLTETEHVLALDPQRSEQAIRAIAFFGQWESMLKFLNSVKNVALLVGALLAIYWATQGSIIDFIQRVAGGN